MSIVISGIRLPYEQADAAALAAARRRCRVDGRQGKRASTSDRWTCGTAN